MKYFFSHLEEVRKKLANTRCLLMLDFDGTLSSFTLNPKDAILPRSTKNLLASWPGVCPPIIITGRSLKDISLKVNLRELVYAGTHGLEWKIGNMMGRASDVEKKLHTLTKTQLKTIQVKYPNVILEDKIFIIAVHYRMLTAYQTGKFKKDLKKLFLAAEKEELSVIYGKKVVEFKPKQTLWNKGNFALFIKEYFEKKLKRKLVPIYAGDDATDEAVFKALKGAITIKVGRGKTYAKYYIKNSRQTERLLKWLILEQKGK